MNEFNKIVGDSFLEASEILGEAFLVEEVELNGVIDEFEMSVDRMVYGNREEATASIVFPKEPLACIKRWPGKIIERVKDCSKFKVLSHESDVGHVTLNVKRIGSRESAD